MRKEFSLSNDKVMMNFTAKYCKTHEELLASNGFRVVLLSYLKILKNKKSNLYNYVKVGFTDIEQEKLAEDIINVIKLLLIMDRNSVMELNNKYKSFLQDKDKSITFIEGLYGFWRKLERYTVIHNSKKDNGLENQSFIDANLKFSDLILLTYRKIEENIEGHKPSVYRQLPAGANVGLIVNNMNFDEPEGYECLNDIPFIDTVIIDPPFIIYPKKNTRDGVFNEVFENPLKNCRINSDHWFCYPIKVGSLLAYIYFHRDFMNHGISLCNLFEMARREEYQDKKPDIIYVFGAKEEDCEKSKTVFYDDKANDIMLGYVSYCDEIDYFGYMKKMTLTLHNLIMISRGYLPIHGAMVNMVTKEGKTANIVIMGDSGAGKSESLEAFRELSETYISDMTIIFDDMGVVKLEDNMRPKGYGTEIGAFVRLDDLDPGYAFREIDRSIFMNPDKINARLVIPVATYNDITKGYPIDLFLYANNYDDGEKLEFFNSVEDALPTFRNGTRMAKGTTTEKGLVNSYFANPFGPVQREKETDKLLIKYFHEFFKSGVKVGQLRTCLGIRGKEKDGPKEAAKKLLQEVKALF